MNRNLPLLVFVTATLASCGKHNDPTAEAASQVRLVEQGHHMRTERIDFADEVKRHAVLSALPSKLPPEIELKTGAVWGHLNRRLRDEQIELEVVLETNLHPLKANQLYLQAPITKVFGHDLQGDALRTALNQATCDDLIAIIIENTQLHSLSRKKEIIFSNYVSNE